MLKKMNSSRLNKRSNSQGLRQRLRRLIVESLEERIVLDATMLRDISPGPVSSSPSNFVQVGDSVFFSANDGASGLELWKSDGTEQGTVLVKDILPGSSGSGPAHLTNVGGTLFFVASDGANGNELWKSDGTEQGTVLVKDIWVGSSGSTPGYLTNVGGTLFFWAYDAIRGTELWKSDGTDEGTVQVKDILPGIGGSSPRYLTNVGGTLFFRAYDAISGTELWKSDGTDEGTVQVKDILPGIGGSSPRYLTNVGGTLFFRASNGTNGYELWRSDGTEQGTVLVKDIRVGSSGSYPNNLTNVGGTLFFRANDGTSGSELWRSDGTEQGTVQVKDILPGSSGSSPTGLTNASGTLFFQAGDGASGSELWKSDGSWEGTVQVKDILPGSSGSGPTSLTNVSGTLFFRAYDAISGYELWRSDGTRQGTVQVKDILPGSGGSGPSFLTNVGGRLFFSADDGVHGAELWVYNPVEVELKPDLKVESFSATEEAIMGGQITVTWNVANIGLIPANFSWRDQVFLSSDPVWDPNDLPLRAGGIGIPSGTVPLAVGGSYFQSVDLQIPPSNTFVAGQHFLILLTDRFGDLIELDKSNNYRSTPIQVSLPPVPEIPVSPAGSEFRVNTFTSSNQQNASIAMDGSGNFVVAWESNGQDGSGNGIYAQRYDAAGVPLGSEFRVNTYTSSHQEFPSIAMDGSGNFVVAWESNGQDGSGNGIYAQRYDAAGVPLGSELRVNTYTSSHQEFPSIAMDGSGNFVIAWQSNAQDGSFWGIYAQRYDADGVPLGGEFQVNSFTLEYQAIPSVAMDGSGNFVIGWQSNGQDGSSDGVYAQRYDSDGVPLGGEFQVNTFTEGYQGNPSVAMDGSSNFVIAWLSQYQDGSGYGIYAQRYDATGVPLGGEFRVNTYSSGNQWYPSIAMNDSGSFVIAWQSDGQDSSSWGVYAQRYDAAGLPLGSEFRVNTFTSSDQQLPSIAMDSSGNFVTAWQSNGQDGSGYGIYAQRYATFTESASFQGLVWEDLDGNHLFDSADLAYSGLTVRLYNSAGSIISTTTTDQTGWYEFAGVPSGEGLFVEVTKPAGKIFVRPDQGMEGDIASGVDTVTGRSDPFVLMAGEGQFGPNAGLAIPAKITGVVFLDEDNDGVRGATEIGLAGWFVYQDENENGQWDPSESSAISDFAGQYSLEGLRAGMGVVRLIDQPPHWTTAAPQLITLSIGETRGGVNFGNWADVPRIPASPAGPEFRVNTFTSSNQQNASIAMDGSGNFVVAWESNGQDGSFWGIYAQRYDTTGAPLGSEFRVNTYTTSDQQFPSIAIDDSGNFVIVWTSNGQDGSGFGIYAQRYSAAGAPLGSEFRVNTFTTNGQSSPSIAMDGSGNFVIAWTSFGQDGSGNGIYAQRYSAAGAPLGSEFRVNTYTTIDQQSPSIAMDGSGNFFIAWQSNGQDGSGYGIYAQRYDASGALLGSEFRVNTYTTSEQRNPSIAVDSQGNFVVAWESNGQDGNGWGIYAQRYDAAGAPLGSEFRVNTFTTDTQWSPSIAMDGGGNFVIAWSGAGLNDSSGIYAQRYDAAGATLGSEFRVNTYITNEQLFPSIAMDGSGNFVVAWTSNGQDGSGYGIYAQRYATFTEPASFQGLVWEDLDGNHLFDSADLAYSGLTVRLYNSAGSIISTTTTNQTGWYEFAGVPSGEGLFVEVTQPAGRIFVRPNQGVEGDVASGVDTLTGRSDPFVLLAGDGQFGPNAGLAIPARITGVVFLDADNDGVLGATEIGLAGWFVYHDENENGQWDPSEPNATSNFTGQYSLFGLRAGVGVVRLVDQPPYWTTAAPQVITLSIGETRGGVNFGNWNDVPRIPASPAGPEFRVNTFTSSNQQNASIAMDGSGNFVVVWSGAGLTDSNGIYAQRYDATGAPLGSEFRVNTYTTNEQSSPSIAMDGSGNFVIAWESNGQDGSGYGIYAQRYDAAGVSLGSEFRVNTYTTSWQRYPSIAMDGTGNFVITWSGAGLTDDGGIYAQRYNTTGAPQGSEFQVNTYTSSDQQLPRIAMDGSGNFVIAWESNGQDGSFFGIYAQRFDADGAPLGSEFLVNTGTSNSQLSANIAMDEGGNFVIAWSGSGPGDNTGIHAQRYSAAGVPLGINFRVNTYTSSAQQTPSIAMDGNGSFVIAWQSNGQDGSGLGIYAQRYDAAGLLLGSEFRVNTYISSDQQVPHIAMDGNGNFVIAWESFGQDGSSWGIYAQRYTAVTKPASFRGLVWQDLDGNHLFDSADLAYSGLAVRLYTSAGSMISTTTTNQTGWYEFAGVPSGEDLLVEVIKPAGKIFVRPNQGMEGDIASGVDTVTGLSHPFVLMAGEGQFGPNAGLAIPAKITGVVFLDEDNDGVRGATEVGLAGWFVYHDENVNGQRDPSESSAISDFAGQYSLEGLRAGTGEVRLIDQPPHWTTAAPQLITLSIGETRGGVNFGNWADVPRIPASPAGPEFRVNTFTSSNQQNASIAMDGSGNFVVAWQSNGQDGNGWGIYAQRYDATGAPLGSEFRVNTYSSSNQQVPSIAMDGSGNFVIAWESNDQDGSFWGIYAQRYSAAGVPLGSEFRVNTYTAFEQQLPSIAMDVSGNFVIAWQSGGQDGSSWGIYAQRYDAAGTPLGSEFRVNTYTTIDQQSPSIAMDGSGNFVIAWTSNGQDGSGNGIYAQRYSAAGAPLGSEFRVNTFTTDQQRLPSIAMDGSGNFVIAWSGAGLNDSSGGIYAQRYDASGALLGSEFRVNTYITSEQSSPSIAMDGSGNFVIAWQSFGQDGDRLGIYAQRYDAAGVRLDGEFRVNTYTTVDQRIPSIAIDGTGNFVIAWESNGQDGNGYGIYAQRYLLLGPVLLSIDDIAIVEGNLGITEAIVSVRLSRPSEDHVSVRYATVDGTARSPQDYQSISETLLIFEPGEIVKTITVQVVGNLVAEFSENFYIDLSEAEGALVESGRGVITIVDDDQADLSVESIDIQPNPAVFGQHIELIWDVRNVGTGYLEGNWTDRVYLSSNMTWEASDTLLVTQLIEATPLAPGAAYSRTASVQLPLNLSLQEGIYYIIVITDALSAQPDAFLENNTASTSLPIQLPPLPDLVVSHISSPTVAFSGRSIEYSWTITNQGTAPATGTWYDRVWISNDNQVGNDQFIGDFSFTGIIEPGQSIVRTRSYILPITTEGNRWFVVHTDHGNQVFEHANDGNNTRVSTHPMVVQSIDLVVTEIQAPETSQFGDDISLSWTVRQDGSSTVSGLWYDQVWLSRDTIVGADDIPLLATPISPPSGNLPLAPGEVYSQLVTVTLPLNETLEPGVYYIVVEADVLETLPELNEGNNFRFTPISIAARPDTIPPFVISFLPPGLQSENISELLIGFSEPMSVASFTTEDVRLFGPIPVVGPAPEIPQSRFTVSAIAEQQFRVSIDPALNQEGQYLAIFGPNITDLSGNPMSDVYQANFEIDRTGPRILSAQPGGTIHDAVSFVDVWFDSAIQAASFTASDVSLVGPHGNIVVGTPQQLSEVVYRIPFEAQRDNGSYLIVVGPNISDLAGNLMDQNENGIAGETGFDVFNHSFNISLPDLVARDIVAAGTLASGSAISLTWQVDNVGLEVASGPWVERVFVSNSQDGTNRMLLGSFFYNSAIAPVDSPAQRSVELTLPLTSPSGSVYFIVEIDATNAVFESDESNLIASNLSYTVPAQLALSFSASQVVEGGAALQGTITRNGDPSLPLVVSLTASSGNQLSLPALVTIPAGQYSQRFNVTALVDNIPDGNVPITVTASSDGFLLASQVVTVVDIDRGTLSLSANVAEVTEGNSLLLSIERSYAGPSPLLVSLSSLYSSQWTVPASVQIPAGQTQATIIIPTVNDLRSEKDEAVSLTATAIGYDAATFSTLIVDDDVPTLTLEVSRNNILERDSTNPIMATVSRSKITENSVRVRLTSSDTTEAVVPSEVVIAAGQLSATFFITPVDDTLFDGTQTVTVQANALYDSCGCPSPAGFGQATIDVLDDETPSLLLESNVTIVREGLSPAGVLTVHRLSHSLDASVEVTLSSSNPSKLVVPPSLTIPAGESSVPVSFSTVSDGVTTGDESIAVTATASGLAMGNRTLIVTDRDLPDLFAVQAILPATGLTGQSVTVEWMVSNMGETQAQGPWIDRIYLSSDNAIGDDILVGQSTYTGSLAPTQNYTRTASILLPPLPGHYWLVIQSDATASLIELGKTNNFVVSTNSIQVQTGYTATVSTSVETAPAGTPVAMTGSATRPDGSPAAFVPVSVHLTLRETKRVLSATTDAAGNFQLTFNPLPGEGGVYTIGAAFPTLLTAPIQDNFQLVGMRAEPSAKSISLQEAGAPKTDSVVLRNLADIPLTGLSVEVLGAPANLLITASLQGGATNIAPSGTIELSYTASALDSTTTTGSFQLRVTSLDAPAITVPISFTVVPLVARLVAQPGSLSKTMLVGSQTSFEFNVTNSGGLESGPIEVLLPSGASWLTLASPVNLPSLAPGASTSITLLLTPPANLPLTQYSGSLIVRGEDSQASVPFTFRAVSESRGDLQVSVVDEYFYYTEEKPLVKTATVNLRDPFTGALIATSSPPSVQGQGSDITVTRDEDGRVSFGGVPEGPYVLEVSSENHESYSSTIRIDPGTETTRQVFIPFNFVTYNWTVEEVDFEDRTNININASFQTNVPAPAIALQYRELGQTAFKHGAVFDLGELLAIGQSKQIDIKITNHGLVSVDNLRFEIGSHPYYEIIPLVGVIGRLTALSEVTVPVILRRVADSSTVTGPVPCELPAAIAWSYFTDDVVHRATPIAVINVDGDCPVPPPVSGGVTAPGGPGGPGGVSTTPITFGNPSGCDPLDPESVCAEVRIRVSQQAVLTRQSFVATLEINNGLAEPLQGIGVDLVISDSNGVVASELFGIFDPILAGISNVNGTGSLAAGVNGSAKWTILPSTEAALYGATQFFVSGTLRYLDAGVLVTVPLEPAAITVMPQPELDLRYFMQRDVISDDPRTSQVEPPEPFTLAVMVQNNGAGDARNLRIESAQPRIIENSQGLLIDYEIVGTQVNGQPMQRSLNADFGTIAAGDLGIAEWLFESTLQGVFVNYSATFEHQSPFGDNRFSVIKSVVVHELIRTVDAVQFDDEQILPDFLVNDLPDPDDLPDTLYLSDGSIMPVGLGGNALSGTPSLANLSVIVTADMTSGWSYLRMDDPSYGNFTLVGVQRSDGSRVPVKNFWQTDRTFIEGGLQPILENKLHLLDYQSTGSYTFIFSNGDLVGPEVVGFAGVTPNPTVTAIGSIDVTFSEPLNLASFTPAAIQLTKNGQPVALTGVAIASLGGSTYRVSGLAPLTADDAAYELTVDATAVTDVVGNAGTESSSYRWVKGETLPTVLELVGAPSGLVTGGVDAIEIVMSKPIAFPSLTASDISLTREGAELIDAQVTIAQVGPTTYRIGNLARLMNSDGSYRFSFDAAGIQDLDGNAGIGDATATWTIDTTSPVLLVSAPPPTNPRNIVVQQIDIEFSEPIDISTLDVSDLRLVRDGGLENLIAGDSRVTFEHRWDNRYRIRGINWVQGFIANPQIADFTFTVDATGVFDLAGNAGVGVLSTTWTIDLVNPLPPTNVRVFSETGEVVGGLLNSRFATVTGNLSESGLNVSIFDLTTNTELAWERIAGTTFNLPIEFPSVGQHRLRVRAVDAAGNVSESLLIDLFVDDTAPMIEQIDGLPPGFINQPVESVTVKFIAPIDPASFTTAALSLRRNSGGNLIGSGVSIVPQAGGRTYVVSGLTPLTSAEGKYDLAIDLSQITTPVGVAGVGEVNRDWTTDLRAPATGIAVLPEVHPWLSFVVNITGNDPDVLPGSIVGSGIAATDLYVSQDGGSYQLFQTLPSGVTSTVFTGTDNSSYRFVAIAKDAAGNVEAFPSQPDAATTIRIAQYSTIVGSYVRHVGFTGSGSDLDTVKILAKETGGLQVLGYNNLINTVRGINGLVFDFDSLPGTLTAADFEFRVSPTGAFDQAANPPDSWSLAPAPLSVMGLPGSPSRVQIVWPDNAINNQWLRIKVLSNDNTQLAMPEVYFIGHLLGEATGPSGGLFTVSFSDLREIRLAVGSTADAGGINDIDKDGLVSLSDLLLVRPRIGSQLSVLTLNAPDIASIVGNFVHHGGYSGLGSPIATGKFLAREDSTAQPLTADNLINSLQGINGVGLDIESLPGDLHASDFVFQMSPQGTFDPVANSPSAWQAAPAPKSIVVTPGVTSRVLIEWPNNAIEKRWLRMTVLANSNTGLAEPEVYYLGHLLGENTGAVNGLFTVSFADIGAVRAAVGNSVDASSLVDIDKNGIVTMADLTPIRQNLGAQLPVLTIASTGQIPLGMPRGGSFSRILEYNRHARDSTLLSTSPTSIRRERQVDQYFEQLGEMKKRSNLSDGTHIDAVDPDLVDLLTGAT